MVRILTFRTPTAVLIDFSLKFTKVSVNSSLGKEFVAAEVLIVISLLVMTSV